MYKSSYTGSEIDAGIAAANAAAPQSTTYTKTEVDTAIGNLASRLDLVTLEWEEEQPYFPSGKMSLLTHASKPFLISGIPDQGVVLAFTQPPYYDETEEQYYYYFYYIVGDAKDYGFHRDSVSGETETYSGLGWNFGEVHADGLTELSPSDHARLLMTYQDIPGFEHAFLSYTNLAAGNNLDNLRRRLERYSSSATNTPLQYNCPVSDGAFILEVKSAIETSQPHDDKAVIQELLSLPTMTIYRRYYDGASWGSWYKFEGTLVT